MKDSPKHSLLFKFSVIRIVSFRQIKMVDQQRQRVEQEMTKMINDIDRTYLRKMQVKTFIFVHTLWIKYIIKIICRAICIDVRQNVVTIQIIH